MFLSAVYPSLTTNIPSNLMAFHDAPLGGKGTGVPLFPHHTQVLEYLQRYADRSNLHRFIRYNSRVVAVSKVLPGGRYPEGGWRVDVRDALTGQRVGFHDRVRDGEQDDGIGADGVDGVGGGGGGDGDVEEVVEKEKGGRVYDAVVIACGNYNVPYAPHIPGLLEWVAEGKRIGIERTVEHARNFRGGEWWRGKVRDCDSGACFYSYDSPGQAFVHIPPVCAIYQYIPDIPIIYIPMSTLLALFRLCS